MRVPLILATLVGLSLSLNLKGPVFDLPDSDDSFLGSVRSSTGKVDVHPEIKILEESGPICSYKLEWEDSSKTVDDIPVEVDLLDRKTGKAQLRLKERDSVKCGEASHYSLLITGKGCDKKGSTDSVSLEITVEAENNHAPEFSNSYYEVTIEEGRLYDQILKFKATDADCEGKFSQICGYEITNNAAGFSIDSQGVLKNTEPLSYNNSHSHILTLTTHDCGLKTSKEVVVTVYVKRSCSVGWLGFRDRLDYHPGSGAQAIAPTARLNFCDLRCTVASINSTFTLSTEHISRGCDRDPEVMGERAKICGRNEKNVRLLPAPNVAVLPDKTAKAPANIYPTDPATEVFFFDGKSNAAEVPEDTVDKSHLGKLSTISFWMKHERPLKTEHHQKEHILCSSDAEHKNRHHFALFVRNCKLELVIRQEFPGEGKNHYEPTEWRWATPAVCDNNWHQYAVNIKFPKVELYVDGHHFAETEKNTEVLEDWPMHATKELKTRMVVGACWHAGVGHMAQFFTGFLSGVTVLSGEVETAETIECLHRCKESLEFHGLDKLDKSGLEAVFNNEMTQVTLKGNNLEAFEEMMQNVGYINTRRMPTPGHRSIKVETSVKCQDTATILKLSPIQSYVFVQKAHNPEIVLFGSRAISKSEDEVKQGVSIFSDLSITIMQENAEGVKEPSSSVNQLESCQISTLPVLDKQNEHLTSPASLIGSIGLDFDHQETGLLLRGTETIKNYREVLQQTHYFNLHWAGGNKRVFFLECRMMNGMVISNKLAVSLTITQPRFIPVTTEAPMKKIPESDEEVVPPAARPFVVHQEIESRPAHHSKSRLSVDSPLPLLHNGGYEPYSRVAGGAASGGAVAIVVVVCVALILVLLVVGIMKLRSTSNGVRTKRQRKSLSGDGDLTWDDSALNITVNPLEVGVESECGVVGGYKTHRNSASDEDDSGDSEDDAGSYRDEDDVSDEDVESPLPHVATSNGKSNGLEWDDSTLNGPANSGPVGSGSRSQMFHV